MNRPAREQWVFRIEPLPSEVPSVNRIRSALKTLLRKYGLRCTAILDEPDLGSHQSTQAPAGDTK